MYHVISTNLIQEKFEDSKVVSLGRTNNVMVKRKMIKRQTLIDTTQKIRKKIEQLESHKIGGGG